MRDLEGNAERREPTNQAELKWASCLFKLTKARDCDGLALLRYTPFCKVFAISKNQNAHQTIMPLHLVSTKFSIRMR